MQDPEHGVPVRSQKLFFTDIPAAFMGEWNFNQQDEVLQAPTVLYVGLYHVVWSPEGMPRKSRELREQLEDCEFQKKLERNGRTHRHTLALLELLTEPNSLDSLNI